MEMPLNVNFYNQYGIDPRTEVVRLRKLSTTERKLEYTQQRESHINHLAQDEAVSILYKYCLSENQNIYTQPSKREIFNIKYQIDPAERNGLFYDGVISAAHLAQKHPYRLVALYSSTGKKLFDDTPLSSVESAHLPFLLKPYKEGQLYFLYFDGKEIKNVAVSIHGNNNPWLAELSSKFPEFNLIADEEQRISAFLKSPILLDHVDDFFDKQWQYKGVVYQNVHGKSFYLDEVLEEMRKTFAGNKQSFINPHDQTIQAMENHIITEKMVINGYLTSVMRFMQKNNMRQITFGGACPGTRSTISEITKILGIDQDEGVLGLLSSFSSLFRYIRQDTEKKWDYHEGECNICHKKPTMVGPCNICVNCEKDF